MCIGIRVMLHRWGGWRARGGRRARGARTCVCVPGRGRARPTPARAASARRPHAEPIFGIRATPPHRALVSSVHSALASLPRHTYVPSSLPSPPSTTARSHSVLYCVVLPNFSVTQCLRTELLLKKNQCELKRNSAMRRLRSGGKAIL